MRISKDTKLSEIQNRFNCNFPSLKLVFYRTPISSGKMLKSNIILDETLTVGEVANLPYYGFFPIDDEINVVDFENMLSTMFELNVKVTSKSDIALLEKSPKRIYTLKEQNALCFEVDNYLKPRTA